MFFNKIVENILNEKYSYFGNCVEFESGNDVLDIVQQDDLSFSEDTYYHDPELRISPKKFFELTDIKPKRNHFYGYNKEHDIVFDYDPEKDIHYFYSKF